MKTKRTITIAAAGFLFNAGYGAYCAFIGIKSVSWWFITLAAYYLILSIMRFVIITSHRTASFKKFKDNHLSRFTGILFVFLSIVLAGTAYLSYSEEQGTEHHIIVMITIALYSFVKIAISIVNIAKIKNKDDASIKTLRNISFADALVSIFSLQRSMLVTFEGLTYAEIKLFNALTGTAVYVLVFILGLNMIGGKRTEMTKAKIIKINEKISKTVVEGYKKIEKGTVDGYKIIEKGAVEGYGKLEDKFVEKFLTKDGETPEEAKERLKKSCK